MHARLFDTLEYLLKEIRVMVRAKDWPVKRITKANVNYYNRIYLFSQIEITLQQKFAVHVHTYKNISLSKADKNSKRKEIVHKVSMWILSSRYFMHPKTRFFYYCAA